LPARLHLHPRVMRHIKTAWESQLDAHLIEVGCRSPREKVGDYLAPGSARSTRCKDQTYRWPIHIFFVFVFVFVFGWNDSFIFGCKRSC